MALNDYAILVGISRYADYVNLPPLKGPVRDVALMYKWLADPSCGAVPSGNIKSIVTNELAADAAPWQVRSPAFEEFRDALFSIILKQDRSDYERRENSRLYLYMSGHGFCEKRVREAHAALYLANADPFYAYNIYGTWHAQWIRDHGLFGEVVLIMDCCREIEQTKQVNVPPYPSIFDVPSYPLTTNVGTGSKVHVLEMYAAPRGGYAEERAISSLNNDVHGLLTIAFLDALEHALPGKKEIPSGAIKDYIEQRWEHICWPDPADRPEIYTPPSGKIVFKRRASADLIQRIQLNKLRAGDSLTIIGEGLKDVAKIKLEMERAHISWADGHVTEVPIKSSVFELPLSASLYRAVSAAQGDLLNLPFQAGEPNVVL